MGRRKKYLTEEELRVARNERAMRYYWRNKEKIKARNLEKYHAKKKESDNL
jgi:hypothetical protein